MRMRVLVRMRLDLLVRVTVIVTMSMIVSVTMSMMVMTSGGIHSPEVDSETDGGNKQKLLGLHLWRVHTDPSA